MMRGCLLAAAASAVAAADSVAIKLGAPIPNIPTLPPNFAGLSYEVQCVPGMLTYNGQPRKSFVNLMNELRKPSGTAGPNLRLGGNSADTSAYTSGTLPANVSYRITDTDFQAYAAVVPLFNGTITPGVNFREVTANGADPTLAVAHITALQKYVALNNPIFEGIEIGNENDLYHDNWIRTPSFTAQDYVTQWNQVVQALYSQAGLAGHGPKIQGATFCCGSDNFNTILDGYITAGVSAGYINSISYHNYPLNVCSHQKNSIYQLLSNPSSDVDPAKLQPYVQTALQAGVPFFIGEGNSIACGGQANISDVFASTLWALDAMLAHAAVGITRWNFHGCEQGAYTAIAYETSPGSPDVPTVRPLFYALWAMATATRQGSQMLAVTTTQSANPLIRTWAVVDSTGKTRVIAIHKDPNATSAASISVTPSNGKASGTATLTRLEATAAAGGVFAHDGITFGGLTFDGSTDGTPSGTPTTEQVPGSNGAYTFNLAPASVAILEF